MQFPRFPAKSNCFQLQAIKIIHSLDGCWQICDSGGEGFQEVFLFFFTGIEFVCFIHFVRCFWARTLRYLFSLNFTSFVSLRPRAIAQDGKLGKIIFKLLFNDLMQVKFNFLDR